MSFILCDVSDSGNKNRVAKCAIQISPNVGVAHGIKITSDWSYCDFVAVLTSLNLKVLGKFRYLMRSHCDRLVPLRFFVNFNIVLYV